MSLRGSVSKPKTQLAKRLLEDKLPKVHENDKTAMFLKGASASQVVNGIMKDLYVLKKPLAIMQNVMNKGKKLRMPKEGASGGSQKDAAKATKQDDCRPFDDSTSLEFLCRKADASLFLVGNHNKKRPHNLVLGRFYDQQILDMVELGIENFQPMAAFSKQGQCKDDNEEMDEPKMKTDVKKIASGTKPCLVFAGDGFIQEKRVQNLFLDFFRGARANKVSLKGLEHLIMFTSTNGKIFMRSYVVHMKKQAGARVPRVQLHEMGPSVDFTVRRTHLASDDLFRLACKQPKEAKIHKTKNVGEDEFGTKHGRVHMQPQDIQKLQTKKMKSLKRKKSPKVNGTKKSRTEESMETD